MSTNVQTFTVPTVDIGAYINGGDQHVTSLVATQIDQACRDVGFIQIVGHGIPRETTDALAAVLDRFFGQDLNDKLRYRLPAGINRGYSPPKSESLSKSLGVESASRMNDFFEAFNVGAAVSDYPESSIELDESEYPENVWPDDPQFKAAVVSYFQEAKRVAHTLTRIFADALGTSAEYFESVATHSIDVMRMNNYALPAGRIELDGDLIGMGEHTDYGMVTVLWADQVAGLQVLGKDDGWHDVMPADGALLVNLGDLAARLTNDTWMSTLHRVKPPIVDGSIKRRRSVAFFHDLNIDALIAPLESRISESGVALYEPITVRDNLTAKLAGSRAGTLNVNAQHEADRVRAASEGR